MNIENEKIIKDYIKNGTLIHLPRKYSKKIIILEYLSEDFELNKVYLEKEVNEKISKYNEDYCTIRRELIINKIFNRNNKGEYIRLK
ncbi:DUF2087 domain-containing protein [Clostridium botulinum]|uniref:DUF2087 domain-containing protein n=1 Tax=Clostridium botulinum TaxID=1491 RepID=UPI000773561F|nr:DUF2087 domain-containing protein [Clostridium botulinum]MBN1040452.1 DUF2087 domain-containing protein [Clostridium botulinum]NFE96237.1 DUF2087 domain-containing protein [Clostridium botulinum]NFI54507.1 DUF2087 domain-containing protein [Clostridium botulinum]NFL39770.1 DUF2087 domain-containing protein [Clostridium botulinum]NFL66638.1 DUF2087 domain-containing protein [Clostridium botulinum]